jgi:ribosomal protein L40E
MKTAKQIEKEVYQAYLKHGQGRAFDVANKYNVNYEYCNACETESPEIGHVCLICGQDTGRAKRSRPGNHKSPFGIGA